MSELVRTALATAASTVPGIQASPYYQQSTTPGHAFVRLDRIEYPNTFGGVCHWALVVLLPQDEALAERFIDNNVPAIREAIKHELVVTQVQPQRLQLDVGVLPCVFVSGHREEE